MWNNLYTVAAAAPEFLAEAAICILAGAVIAYLCSRLGLVPIVGFLATGVVIGPNALGLVRNQELITQAAELGVILLLYTIGIEFSLDKLARIKKLIFGGGGLQVGLVTLATAGLLMFFDVDWKVGLFTGFLVALSSTAIVLKLLGDRGETNADHGQVGLGLLIFQDLAIIAMVLLVPGLAGQGGSLMDIAWALGKAGLIIVVVLAVARRLMPPVLERVALTCSPEIFLLSVIAICLSTAYLTSLAGISVSLGAFLAGLVVSESRFSHHAFAEIMPLQILFSAIFFVSVGMLLDLDFFFHNLPLVLAAISIVLLLKVLTTGLAALALGYRLPVAISSSLMLAQVGEFSFVLEHTGREMGLYPAGMAEVGSQTFIAATVVLMVLTPALTRLGATLAERLESRREAAEQKQAEATVDPETEAAIADLDGHVLISGYAQSARRLVPVFKERGIPLVVTTLSPTGANEVEALGLLALRGDSTKGETLRHAGIQRARAMIIADDEPAQAQSIAHVARSLNPDLHISIRTRSTADVVALHESGADEVITEELESTLSVCGGVLALYGISGEEIAAHAETVRQAASRGELAGASPAVEVAAGSQPTTVGGRTVVDTEQPVELTVAGETACSHVASIRRVLPRSSGCEECLAKGDSWVHLRVCMTCGHVGCCDTSPNQHATAHHHATGHPIVRSLEPGETWGWCYVDEEML
ncbi:MAG: cation:proton antiporter [Acidobacteriota bacterium]